MSFNLRVLRTCARFTSMESSEIMSLDEICYVMRNESRQSIKGQTKRGGAWGVESIL